MRIYVATIILALAAIALAVGLSAKPLETPLVIDAQSPGVWPDYAAEPMGDAPANMLVMPCPLTPQNLPILSPDWKA